MIFFFASLCFYSYTVTFLAISGVKPTILPFSLNHLNASQIKLNHVELEKNFDCLYFDSNDHYLIKTETLLTKATTATLFFFRQKTKTSQVKYYDRSLLNNVNVHFRAHWVETTKYNVQQLCNILVWSPACKPQKFSRSSKHVTYREN